MPEKTIFKRSAIAATLAALSLSPLTVTAEGDFALEEVVVTAQKRSESLQETPISMQAFSADELQKRAAGDISQVAEFTPSVQFDSTSPISGSSNAAVVFIRGIGQTDFVLTSEAGVGIYLDGVYMARSMGGVLDLMDIEQVEVLRGPQGTLFGKNTVGGAISVTTRKPGQEVEAGIGITVGTDERRDAQLMFNVPVIDDRLFLRVSAATKNRDGYGDRVLTGETMGDMNSDTVRASLRWLATDTLDMTLSLDKTSASEDMPVTSLITADPLLGGPMNNLSSLYNLYSAMGWVSGPIYDDRWIMSDDDKSSGTAPVGSELDVWGASLMAEWSLDDITVKSITGYRETESEFGRDTDHSPVTIIHTANTVDMEQFSQEFNFSGVAFDGALDWLVGLYYFSEEAIDRPDIDILPAVFEADMALAPFNGGLGYLGRPPIEFSVSGTTEIENTSRAIFTHNTYDFSEQLSATFGIRYTEEEKIADQNYVYPTLNVPLLTNPKTKQTFYDVSSRVGLEYRWSEDFFTYASYSEGFKSGGVVSRYNMPRVDPIEFEPEEVKSYEMGFKSEWVDGRVRLNGSAFFTDYSDIQVTVFNGVVPETRNAAEGEIKGVELEFTGLVTEQFMITGGLGYLDAAYTKLDAATGGALEVTEGHEFVNTPEWTANVAFEYTMPVSDMGELMWRLDYSYRSEIANDAANTAVLMEDGMGLVNAKLMFTADSGKWEASLFGRNLADEEYLTSGVSTTAFGIVEGIYGRPREVGLSLKYLY